MSSAAPLPPGTEVAGLVVEPSGVIWWQWITFFVLGNLFGDFWVAKAFLNAFPQIGYRVNLLLVKLGLSKAENSKPSRVTLTPEQQQQQQEQQIHELSQQLSKVPTSPSSAHDSAPAGSGTPAPKPVTLHHLSSVAHRGTEVSSPLSSHRSKPLPPTELCLEQNITPRAGLPLSPRTSRSGGAGTPSASDVHSPYGEGAGGEGGGALDSGAAADPLDDDEASMTTDSSEAGPVVVKLEWRNLCYAVKSAAGLRLTLQGIYGCANPSELQGLMGPSGAGKTTLMDILSKRTNPTGSAQAEVLLHEQHKGLSNRLKTLASGQRHSDSTNPRSSTDGGATSPVAADVVEARHTAVSVAGLRSSIHASDTLPVLESKLLVNGAPLSSKAFMKISAYVPQHDNLVPAMTTWESLSFYADIVLPPDMPEKAKKKRINDVLQMMGLTRNKDTLVGGVLPGGMLLRGLSGGERKRVAISCGLVAQPSLVFLDEPTSGLDSFAALNVVLYLKNLATTRGATLIASLHQPRSAIWAQLDQITLLADSRLMYTGPTEELTKWFTSLGYDFDPSTHGMASDWALDLVSLGFDKPQQGTPQQEGEAQVAPAGGSLGPHGSLRQRGLASLASSNSRGLHGVGSSRYTQQATSSKRPMMTSKQELRESASAFLRHLRDQHPDWFVVGAEEVACTEANGNGQAGLSPIKVHHVPSDGADVAQAAGRDNSDGAVQALGDDTALSPFILQESFNARQPAPQQQPGQLQLTPADMLEQRKDGDVGLWRSLRIGWHKYTALLWRELLITTRDPADVGGRMLTFTYVSLLSGIVAWNMPGGADSIMSRISSAYAVLSFYLLMPFVFMSLFTSDKRFFAVDTTARLYHPFQYYMAKMSVTLPFNVMVAVVFHLVYYGMIGMRHGAAAMGQSCVISVLMGLIAMQAVYCCAIVATSQDLAFVYAIAWTALNLLVNPYMAMFDLYSLGWGVSWLRFFSPYNFAWQALVKIELAGRAFDCNSNSGLRVLGLIPDLLPKDRSFATVRNVISNLGNVSGGKCVASGDAVVQMYTTGLSFGATVGILLAYFALFLAVTYLVVWRSSKKKGPSL